MIMKLAQRHYCVNQIDAGVQAQFHARKDGAPRSRWCTYCHGNLVVERGLHGVFKWSGGSGRYSYEDAVKTFASPTAAKRYADAHAEDNVVVRWLPESVLPAGKAPTSGVGTETTVSSAVRVEMDIDGRPMIPTDINGDGVISGDIEMGS